MKDITKFIIILIISQSKLFSKEQTFSITCSFQNYVLVEWFVDYEYNKKECNNHKITFRIPDKRSDNTTNQFIDLKIDRELGIKILNKYYDNYVGELPQYTENDLYEKIVYKLRDKYLQSEFIFKFKESTCINGSEKEKYLELLSVIPKDNSIKTSKNIVSKNFNLDEIIPMPFIKYNEIFEFTRDSVWRLIYGLTQELIDNGIIGGDYRYQDDPVRKYRQPTTLDKQLNFLKSKLNNNSYNFIFYDDNGLGSSLGKSNETPDSYDSFCSFFSERNGEKETIRCRLQTPFISTKIFNDTLLFPRPYNKIGTIRDSLTCGTFDFQFYKDKLFCLSYINENMERSSYGYDKKDVEYSNKIVSILTKRLGKPKKWYGWYKNYGEIIELVFNLGDYNLVLNGFGKGIYKGMNYPFRIARIVFIEKSIEDEVVRLHNKILTERGYSQVDYLPYGYYLIKD